MPFRNMSYTRPADVADGDGFALKIVAVAGHNNDWAAYYGPTDWTDEAVGEQGIKLHEEQAVPLFYVLRNSRRTYRP